MLHAAATPAKAGSPEAQQAGRHGSQRPERGGAAADLGEHCTLRHTHQPACSSLGSLGAECEVQDKEKTHSASWSHSFVMAPSMYKG